MVVDVELEEGPSRLVVEGRIEKYNDSGYQSIKLSTTDEYFSNSDNPSVKPLRPQPHVCRWP